MPEEKLWGTSHGGYRADVQTPPQTLPADIAEQADVDARSIARVLTDSFAGIAPKSMPGFIAAQLAAVAIATPTLKWLFLDTENRCKPQ